MQERLGNDQELCDKLIPHYELGCRRATPGDGYLEALREKNARVNVNPIVQITESGIQTAQEHTEFDIIVCATGFDVSYRPSWTVQGRNGHQLNIAWSDFPEAYFGITAANTPNYFILNGPNSPGKCPRAPVKERSLTASSGSWISPRQHILRGEMDIEMVSEDSNGRYQVFFEF